MYGEWPNRKDGNSSTHHCMYENNLNPFQKFYNLLLDALNHSLLVNTQWRYVRRVGPTSDKHSYRAGCDPSNRLTKLDYMVKSACWKVTLPDNQNDWRDHGDSSILRAILDFSNVHICHTDGYIPRKKCVHIQICSPSRNLWALTLVKKGAVHSRWMIPVCLGESFEMGFQRENTTVNCWCCSHQSRVRYQLDVEIHTGSSDTPMKAAIKLIHKIYVS